MEPRFLIAYGLIVGLVVIGAATVAIASRRRVARRRRLRGIKDHNGAPVRK